MKEELSKIIEMETKALEELLKTLEEQHGYIVKNSIFKMEEVVAKLDRCNKEIAKWEMERRKLTQGEPMSKIVDRIGDPELDNRYRKIKRVLEALKLQKETNELLIRQGLGFTTQMLNILNPNKNSKTYNSYGKPRR